MAWTRYLKDEAYFYAKLSVERVVSVLKPIAKVIENLYHREPVTHFRQGVQQYLRLPHFLKYAEETRKVIQFSVVLNMVKYFVPTLIFRRGINTLYFYSPHTYPLTHVVNFAGTSYLPRLIARRLKTNFFISMNLSRTVPNDLDEFLPVVLSQLLANDLANIFYKIVVNSLNSEHFFYKELFLRLQIIFKTFFGKYAVSQGADFKKLEKIFQKNFAEILIDEDYKKETIAQIAASIAKILVESLTKLYDEQTAVYDSAFLKLLKHFFEDARAKNIVVELIQRVELTLRNLKPYFPKQYMTSCRCIAPTRRVKGMLSSPIYYSSNILLFGSILPFVTKKFAAVLRQDFLFAAMLTYSLSFLQNLLFMMLILIYGNSLNELKINACTRHCYQIFSRNKMLSLALGLIYYFGTESGAYVLKKLMNYDSMYEPTLLDDFITDNAVQNVVLHLSLIAVHAFREMLPGRKIETDDYFKPPRKLARLFSQYFQDLLPTRKSLSAENLYEKITKVVYSPYLHASVEWVFQGYELFPAKLISLYKNQPVQTAALSALTNDEMVKLFFKLNVNDIDQCLEKIQLTRTFSKKILDTKVSWLLPAPLVFILSLLLVSLKDETLEKILQALKQEITKQKDSFKVEVFDEVEDAKISAKPAHSQAQIVLALEESKKNKPPRVLQEKVEEEKEPGEEEDYILVNDDEDEFCVVPYYARNPSLRLWQPPPASERSNDNDLQSAIELKHL